MIRIVTRRAVIKEARDRWLKTYARYPDAYVFGAGRGRVGLIRDALHKLDVETCTPQEAAQAFGNSTWSDNNCDECGRDMDTLVRIGQEPDHDVRWQDLCAGCLAKAAAMLQPV